MNYYPWDLETYLNCFLFAGKFFGRPEVHVFEISSRRNDRDQLLQWLGYLQTLGVHMVGYNSLGFDYPILHQLLTEPYTFDALKAHAKAQAIIGHDYGVNPHMIGIRDRIIPQIDLVKVNHFDNRTKRTSLKALQFAMRSESVEDLPFDPMKELNSEQMDVLRSYNVHDITETEKFLVKCIPMIEMRKDLLDNGILTGDVLNYSDVKIGTEYLIGKIGRQKCFIAPGKPRQSLRTSVNFREIILPKIEFQTEAFREVLTWFKDQTIWMGKSERPKLKRSLGQLLFDFGVGGVHASVENKRYETNEESVILDVDVGGMYPSIAVANNFAPEHLGQAFAQAYRQLQADRKQYPKGSMMNLVLKLANNGVFGNSNNEYSPFYDPKFTFSITINGQLQLLQLAEYFSLIPGVELIQANTDGITALVPKKVEPFFHFWCGEWETATGLKLEHAVYDRMWIRDVNNYIAIDTKGKIKRKGAYWYPLTDEDYHGSSGSNWNKDFSNLAAQRGVEACLLHGYRPEDIIRTFSNPFDFMLRYKTPAGAKVYIGEREQLKTVRYYVSTAGQPMKKIAMPKGIIGQFKRKNGITDEMWAKRGEAWDPAFHTKNKSRYEMAETAVESGWLIKECNKASDFSWQDVDYRYYEKEVSKLLIGEDHATHIL
jgi:hypothetical protein